MPAMSNRPPSGPDWLHEIKFDGYRVIARKDGGQVRLWARTTSDYSKAFTRIRDAVAALPVHSAVLDGEAVVMRPDNSFDFETLRSRQGQAEAILVAYDIMDADGQDLRPEPLEERRKRLAKLLSRSNKALRDGIQLSEAITGDGAAIFRHACWMDLEGIVSKRIGSRYVSGRTRAWLKTRYCQSEGEFHRCSVSALNKSRRRRSARRRLPSASSSRCWRGHKVPCGRSVLR
jgi:bifunctional non-homologous end joining protein LigD